MARAGLILSAAHSGAGKTTVTLALLAALNRRGLSVAGGKSGPDYIDPPFHAAACGAPSMTYDAWAMDADSLRARAASCQAEMLVIEGAMGALDGAGRAGVGSSADLAAALGLPVVLILDAARAGASVALPAAGFRALRPEVPVAGVLLNRVGSARHAAMCRHALQTAGFAVLGSLPRAPDLRLPERHLGLVQAAEHEGIPAYLDRAADWIGAHADLDALIAAATAPTPPAGMGKRLPPLGQRIAIARDVAFSFAYPHMLDDWQAQGAELLPFSPLRDEAPDPSADAVFLPGGYPELHGGALAAAHVFREGMQAAAARDALIYGECGGYMALGEGLIAADGTRHPMLGLLPLETSFAARKLHLGYRRLSPLGGPWAEPLMGHEFHYASVTREEDLPPLFEARDADGADPSPMGLRKGRVSGSFAHVISPA